MYPMSSKSSSASSSTTPNVASLFQAAADDGTLTPGASQALVTIPDIGQQIQAALGVSPDDVTSSEVVLVTMMPDDSGSMAGVNAQLAREGHNLVLEALGGSKQSESVLAHTRYLNGYVLYPYCQIAQAVRLDNMNYDPCHSTPLYDQSVVLLGTVLAKAQEFEMNGVPARTITLIITDGADCRSTHAKAKDVAKIVADMRRSEKHIVAALGIDDGYTDFRQVFKSMGIEDKWILTPKNNASDIRAAFLLFSKSAVRASQSSKAFSATAGGGFGNP